MMKNIFKQMHWGLLATVAVLVTSCETEKLDDVITKDSYAPVNISLAAKTDIGTGANFTMGGGELTVPVTLSFSAPTTRAFSLALSASSEGVPQMITAGVLPVGTLPVTSGSFNVPSTVEVPLGVSSFNFNLTVSRSFIELNYGSNIAVAVKIASPAKENAIEQGKDQAVVLVKTAEVLKATDVHNITFGTPDKVFPIPSLGAYTIGSESIEIRVPITIQGDLGSSFTVQAIPSPDSVTKYINNGTLTGVANYPVSNISVNSSTVMFDANTRTSYLVFLTKRDVLLKVIPRAGEPTKVMPVVAFTLKNPSKYQIGKTMNTVFVKLDPNFFRPYNGTPFLVKGAINAVSDPIYAAYYDFGGKDVAWWDNGGKSGDGGWRVPDEVDVSGDYNPRTAIGWTATNEYVTYSINVEETGTYQMDMYFGASNSNGRYSVFVDNVDINGGIKASQNTGAHNNQKSHLSTVQLTKGYHIFKVFFNGGDPDYRGTIFTRKS